MLLPYDYLGVDDILQDGDTYEPCSYWRHKGRDWPDVPAEEERAIRRW